MIDILAWKMTQMNNQLLKLLAINFMESSIWIISKVLQLHSTHISHSDNDFVSV